MVPWWCVWPNMSPVGGPNPNEPPIWADVAIGAIGAVGIIVDGIATTEFVWIRKCVLKLNAVANTLWHSRHLYTSLLARSCIKCNFFLWATMSRFRVNDFPQISQCEFLIPVWVDMCRDKSPDVKNPLLQTGQIWSRIPVWIFLWAWKLPNAANCLEQISHCSGFSPVWVLKTQRQKTTMKTSNDYIQNREPFKWSQQL